MSAPLSEQQRAELAAIAERATALPLFVSDCEGDLQVWAESALQHVTRDAGGQIAGYSLPSSYRVEDQVMEMSLGSWDPGESATDDYLRERVNDLVDARAALPALLADNARLSAQVAEMIRVANRGARMFDNPADEVRHVRTVADAQLKRANALEGVAWDLRERAEKTDARVAALEAERHVTNEALSDAAEALRAKDERITALEKRLDVARAERSGQYDDLVHALGRDGSGLEWSDLIDLATGYMRTAEGLEKAALPCVCFAADMHTADCARSLLTVDGVEYSAAHWYRDKDSGFWVPIAHLDGSLELLCCGDSAYEPMPIAEAIAEIGPITRTGFPAALTIEQVRAAAEAGEVR